ncbi:phage terminase large subunit [Bacillus infantis]|uniref:phage terminase large subunit n=1 Tax=Bacillus infantis TaxID=324767 RepID=UPI003CED0E7B
MNDQQKELLIEYLLKHFSADEVKDILNEYRGKLTGQNGLRKMLAEIDKDYFGKAYFPKYFERPSPIFHKEIEEHLQQILDGVLKNVCVIAPRGFSKSTLGSFKIPLYCLLFRKKPFILLVSASEDMAQEFLKSIRTELESNDAILEDFGELKGNTWNSDKLVLTNNTCVMAKGADSTLRGIKYGEMRPHLVISDDIQKDSSSNSESKMVALKNFYYESLGNIGDTYTSNLFIGTRMGETDLVLDVQNNPTYYSLYYQAVISFATNQELWDEWEEIVKDLSNPYRLSAAETFFEQNKEAMLEGTEVIWEEKMDYYDLMLKRIEIGDDAFAKELQNDPKSAKDRLFHELKYHDGVNQDDTEQIVLTIDPSLGKNNRADFSAITVMGKDTDGYFHVIEGDCRRLKPKQLIAEVIEKLKRYPVNRIGVETVNFQDLLREQLEVELVKNGFYIEVVAINSRTKKHERIMGLQPLIANGYIKFNKNNKAYNQQILDYPGKNDDAADSLEMSVTLLKTHNRLESMDRRLLGI